MPQLARWKYVLLYFLSWYKIEEQEMPRGRVFLHALVYFFFAQANLFQ